MLREITKQVGPRLRPGDAHDYPLAVWQKIAADAKRLNFKEFPSLDAFSKAIAHNPALQSPLKGRLRRPQQRLGA